MASELKEGSVCEFDNQKVLKSLKDAQKWHLKGIRELMFTFNVANGIAAFR